MAQQFRLVKYVLIYPDGWWWLKTWKLPIAQFEFTTVTSVLSLMRSCSTNVMSHLWYGLSFLNSCPMAWVFLKLFWTSSNCHHFQGNSAVGGATQGSVRMVPRWSDFRQMVFPERDRLNELIQINDWSQTVIWLLQRNQRNNRSTGM